jgi:hypothetical protein
MAQDMRGVFISMPDSVAPLLTKVNREDCVDFLDSNMKAVVRNRFDKESELKTLTKDYLLMQMTATSTMEIKLLPMNDSVKVVCVVRTVQTDVPDSDVRFYDTMWKELPADDYFSLPTEDAFYLPTDSIDEELVKVRKKADMYLVKYSLSSERPVLEAEYTTPDYLNEEDRKELLKYLRKEPLVLEWKNGRFE